MMYLIAAMQPIDIGPATLNDPQCVATRHRRERISERMRILQRLVPGGAKMDTTSVLDEAVRYIKLLKKQVIKLQSSNQNSHCIVVPIINDEYRWHVPSSVNNIVTFTETMPPSTEDYFIPRIIPFLASYPVDGGDRIRKAMFRIKSSTMGRTDEWNQSL
ncbi:hypothetical protein C5167_006082, partial [Papaver somniferum]